MIRSKIRQIVVVADEKLRAKGIVSATDIVTFVRENSDAMAQVTIEVLEASNKKKGHEIYNDLLLRGNPYSMQ